MGQAQRGGIVVKLYPRVVLYSFLSVLFSLSSAAWCNAPIQDGDPGTNRMVSEQQSRFRVRHVDLRTSYVARHEWQVIRNQGMD